MGEKTTFTVHSQKTGYDIIIRYCIKWKTNCLLPKQEIKGLILSWLVIENPRCSGGSGWFKCLHPALPMVKNISGELFLQI